MNPQTDNTAICHLEQQEANALVTETESTGLIWVNKMESCILEYIQESRLLTKNAINTVMSNK